MNNNIREIVELVKDLGKDAQRVFIIWCIKECLPGVPIMFGLWIVYELFGRMIAIEAAK